jgi:hypothetical protein
LGRLLLILMGRETWSSLTPLVCHDPTEQIAWTVT